MTAHAGLARRIGTVARWPVGMAFTSWRYLWRITPLHRTDEGTPAGREWPLDPRAVDEGLQRSSDGVGPLFHRRYAVDIADAERSPDDLVSVLATDPGKAAPVEVAVFWKTRGREGQLRVGDEFLVRMPGPWDGPVRVVDRTPTSFRLATMRGHLEAGQIEFRARGEDGLLRFEIESWARSGDRLSALLYTRVRLIKEMQLHMWTCYCERIASLARGRRVGGVGITTGHHADAGGTTRSRPAA